MNKFDLIIVGGGASGLICAIRAASNGFKTLVLEQSDRIAKKIIASGNGRCNLSNLDMTVGHYNTSFVNDLLSKYNPSAVIDYFESLGLLCTVEQGRVYPLGLSSAIVVNILINALKVSGVQVMTQQLVSEVKKVDNTFKVSVKGQDFFGENVVLACGSNAGFGIDSLNLAKPLNHKASERRAGLAPLKTNAFKGANGIRVKASAKLVTPNKAIIKSGEFLLKDTALSGILAFEMSLEMARLKMDLAQLIIDFLPDISHDKLIKFLLDNCNAIHPLLGVLPKALAQIVLSTTPMDRSLLMSPNKAKAIADSCKSFKIQVASNNGFDNAQVCVGGLDCSQFDSSSLQSKLCRGLFCCGEMLDVDGDCGGYNLHWAWASGMAIADYLIKNK